MIIIYITHENMEQAKKVITPLIESKLIACANYFPMTSSYWWKGKVENSKEIVSLVKTKEENWEKVKDAVEKSHPYDVPCIIKINSDANNKYLDWINHETQNSSSSK